MQSIDEALSEYTSTECVTIGEYRTEDDAKEAFVDAIRSTNCFNVYPEVDCWYFGGSVFGDKPTGRIDYVLTPRKSLIDKGWVMGCIGVEVKKSGHKAGPIICQMIDYSKAIFRLPDSSGASLVCMTSVCCFPGFKKSGSIASIMANNRLGIVALSSHSCSLKVDATNLFSADDRYGIRFKTINCGYKNGSR